MKNRVNRIIAVALLVIAASLLSVSTFAYWADTITNPASSQNSNNVTIGQAKAVTTKISIENNTAGDLGQLVPVGRAADSNNEKAVEKITLDFTVNWSSGNTNAALGTKGLLEITPETATFGGDDTYGHLINVKIVEGQNTEIIADQDEVKVKVEVTLTEPANKEEYEAIKNQEIEIPFTFHVA